MTTVPPRSQVDPRYTWNAASVFASREAWSAELGELQDLLPLLEQFKGSLTSAESLADCLERFDAVSARIARIYVYASFSKEVDATDNDALAMTARADNLYAGFAATSAFLEPEILALPPATLDAWVSDEPRLAVYAQYLHNLARRRAHVRSADVEEVLGMFGEPFAGVPETASMLTNADLQFPPARGADGADKALTQGTIAAYLNDGDRETRRTAWENYADSHLSIQHGLASNLMVNVRRAVVYARARRYPSALEASLFENNIPPAVFHNLIDTYKANLPTWHRYWRARKKALGVDTLQPYDVWAPLTPNNPVVSYEQAVEWIADGMQPLGADYVETVRRGCLQDGWVDVYPNIGKRQGAFSSGTRGTHPFIMMSYNDNLMSLSTLAHEIGHSMHSYLTWQTQPQVYSGYSLFVAEVASNFNQAMVRAHLFRTQTDRDFQIALIEEAMYNFHRYFFIMPTLARFEVETHARAERGEGMSADDLNGLMADLFSEGYGDVVHVDRARVGITWAQFVHMYYNFYVYQYSTGISAAHALAAPILAGDKDAAERYLAFLRAGSSVYPLDALKAAGVDMTTPAAVDAAFKVLAGLVDRLESLT
jgi:oligoendopeptidase F